MSKRKRESTSPKQTASPFMHQSTPISLNPHKLNLSHSAFNIHAGKITKSNSTNTLLNNSFSFNNGISLLTNSTSVDMDLDLPSWKPKPPKYNTPIVLQKQIHSSTSSSSIESSLSLAQSSNTSSVENLSIGPNSLPNEMSTPNNSFKFVKPLQTAFNSSGLLSKKKNKSLSAVNSQLVLQSPMVFNQNGILIERKSNLSFPDTPCKSVSSVITDTSSLPNTSGDLINFLKKTARQLLSEFKASKNPTNLQYMEDEFENLDSFDQDSLRKFSNRFRSKNTKNISISVSSSYDNHSPLSKEMYDDFHSPVMTRFARKKKNKEQTPVPLNTSCNYENEFLSKPSFKHGNSKKLQLTVNSTALHGSKFSALRTPTTPIFTDTEMLANNNPFLTKHFGSQFKILGKGEFSKVYRVDFQESIYAIKQLVYNNKGSVGCNKYTNASRSIDTKLNNDKISDHLGIRSNTKLAINEEVEILNAIKIYQLQNQKNDNAKYIISYVDFFLHEGNDYIITQFYANGSLDQFLLSHGISNRLDEFRIWKILLELSKGLCFLHGNGIIHLDLKPANIFISNEGHLKIGDFGLSTIHSDAESNAGKFDKEGDREYIAPEVLSSSIYDTPADIFSLGLIIVEIAANIYLPDNGVSWQKLRNGDLSDAGNLSTLVDDNSDISHGNTNFVNDGKTLDLLVHWMIEPDYKNRPTITQLLNLFELTYIEYVRKKPATIHEAEYDVAAQLHDRLSDFNDIMIEENIYDFDSHYQSVNDLYSLNKFQH